MSLQMLFAIASIASYFSVNAFVVHGPKLPASRAMYAIGKMETVCGAASRIQLARKNHLKPMFVTLGKPDRDHAFEIVIVKNDLPRFGQKPDTWKGKRICARGLVRSYDDHPIIIASSPGQVRPDQ